MVLFNKEYITHTFTTVFKPLNSHFYGILGHRPQVTKLNCEETSFKYLTFNRELYRFNGFRL